MQGLRQAQDIGGKFGLPGNVLPQILSGGYLPVIQELVRSQAEQGVAPSKSLPSQPSQSSQGLRDCAELSQASVGYPGIGSPAWRQQLECIREVCRGAAVDHSIIDGFLLAVSPDLQQSEQPGSMLQRMTDSGGSEHAPNVDGNAIDFVAALDQFCDDEVFGDMDTDPVDNGIMPAWAP